MLKETSVIAVAGFRKFALFCCFLVCGAIAILLIILGILKTLGLFGAMAMLSMPGMTATEDASQNAGLHIFMTAIVFLVAYLFISWAKKIKRRLETPFENDIKVAADIVSNIEANTKSSARSIRDATRTAISEANNRYNEASSVRESHAKSANSSANPIERHAQAGPSDGSQLNIYDEDGLTPLMRASKIGDLTAVNELLSKGADPSLKDGVFGTTTALSLAKQSLATASGDDIENLSRIIRALSRTNDSR